MARGAVAQIFTPGAPISGHVCGLVMSPLDENPAIPEPSCSRAATPITRGILAYGFVCKSLPSPPELPAANTETTLLSYCKFRTACEMALDGSYSEPELPHEFDVTRIFSGFASGLELS